jgi:hypothetical protein
MPAPIAAGAADAAKPAAAPERPSDVAMPVPTDAGRRVPARLPNNGAKKGTMNNLFLIGVYTTVEQADVCGTLTENPPTRQQAL